MHDHHSKLLHWKLFPSLSWFSAFTHVKPITQRAAPHSSHIPQELIDHIIDIMGANEDHSTLKACATTSRAFLSRCRQYLFRTFDLSKRAVEHDGGHGLMRLSHFLQGNPTICTYIRDVRVSIVSGDVNWRKKERMITAILKSLSAVQSLTLQSYYLHQADWTALTPDLKSVILKIISSHSIKHLQLCAISNIPLAPISRGRDLRSLRLVDIDPALSSLDTHSLTIDRDSRPCPEELVFEYSNTAIQTLLQDGADNALVDFSRLRSLRVYPQFPDDVSIAWEVAQVAGLSLRSLEFYLSHEAIHPLPGPFDLAAIPNLQHFLLLVLFEGDEESLGGTLEMLDSIADNHVIEEIIIKILVGFGVSEDDPRICAEIPWASLEATLMRSKFSRLNKLCLELHFCDYDVDFEDDDSGKQANDALAYELQEMTTPCIPNLLSGKTPFEVQFFVHVHHDLSVYLKQRSPVK